jgi:hypothetical protein
MGKLRNGKTYGPSAAAVLAPAPAARTCHFRELPSEIVCLILRCLDCWDTGVAEFEFARTLARLGQCCHWLQGSYLTYEPLYMKAAKIAWEAKLIVAPWDNPDYYHFHELVPYSEWGSKDEQETPVPDSPLQASNFLRCKLVRFDQTLPAPAPFAWLLGTGLPYCSTAGAKSVYFRMKKRHTRRGGTHHTAAVKKPTPEKGTRVQGLGAGLGSMLGSD